MNHEGRRYLVTGAAGGIGGAIVERLRGEGARVATTDLRPPDPSAHGGAPPPAPFRACDIALAGAADELVEWAEEEIGPLDGVVHCAASGLRVTLIECEVDDWCRVIDVNLTGAFSLARASARAMSTRGHGVFLAFASGAGLRPNAGNVLYGSAKAGVLALVRAMAVDLGLLGIRVNAVTPGPTDTPLLVSLAGDAVSSLKERIMLRRLALPPEIAATTSFLLSEDAGFITGANIVVDGGFTTSGTNFIP